MAQMNARMMSRRSLWSGFLINFTNLVHGLASAQALLLARPSWFERYDRSTSNINTRKSPQCKRPWSNAMWDILDDANAQDEDRADVPCDQCGHIIEVRKALPA